MAKRREIIGFSVRGARRIRNRAGGVQTREIDENRKRGSGGSGSARLFMSPVGGIPARSGTTISSATCTRQKIVAGVLTAESTSDDIYNPWPVAIPGNYPFPAQKERGSNQWIALFPGVVNVRWLSPNLQQTSDGINYTTIDTAENC